MSRRAVLATLAGIGALALPALAQHEHHDPPEAPTAQAPADPTPEPAPAADLHEDHAGPSALSWLDARTASGTAWQPDDSPAWGWHVGHGRSETMVHGVAFLDVVSQGGRRGDDDVGLTGWAMAMRRWPVGRGRLTGRLMLSPEAAAWGERGVPQLFQFGEAVDGALLVDRQHPHDLFMELGLLAEAPLGDRWAFHAYLAPSGEPALGPPAFPHRASAADNPQATLGHHQQDSTHISFGVVTLGVSSRFVRIEGSAFNGREPDQERYDFDFAALDSHAARISVNPSPQWSLQLSAGHLEEPEELKPGVDADRLTASVHHSRTWTDGFVASALICGSSEEDGEPPLRTLTAETTLGRGRHSGTARFERADRAEIAGLDHGHRATVLALTLGYAWDLHVGPSGRWAIGGQVTLHDVPPALEGEYGSGPAGVHVYGRWRPPRLGTGHAGPAH